MHLCLFGSDRSFARFVGFVCFANCFHISIQLKTKWSQVPRTEIKPECMLSFIFQAQEQRHEACLGPAAIETSIRCKVTLRDAIFNLEEYGLLGTKHHVLYYQDRPKGFFVVLSNIEKGSYGRHAMCKIFSSG